MLKLEAWGSSQHTQEGRGETTTSTVPEFWQTANGFHSISGVFNDTCNIYYIISCVVWIGFSVSCNQTHVPWYASCRGPFCTQAPLLCSPNLDLHKKDQFQMGNEILTKKKSKGLLKESPSRDFYPILSAQFNLGLKASSCRLRVLLACLNSELF